MHVDDARKNELELAGVGECIIEALLFKPLLSESYRSKQVIYYLLADGKNIHIGAADKDHRHIHLVYDGKDHFNALISEAAAEKAAT